MNRQQRTSFLVRLNPEIHRALTQWAADDLRSLNAQIELLLRDALRQAGRLPKDVPQPTKPGRPRRNPASD